MWLHKHWLAITICAGIAESFAWLQWSFSNQVNASMAAQNAVREVKERTVSGVKPQTLTTLDYYGRPFLYLASKDCDVIISYGANGKPDDTYDLSMCSLPTGRQAMHSACAWPTMDTIYINGEPRKACGTN